MTKYVVVSDWHIGSEVCQRDKIIQFLKTIKTEVLILNGDIIDIDHLKRLNKKDWKILSLLRKMSKATRVIYLPGNHDYTVYELISELIGLEHYKSFDIEIANKKCHIVHGDIFDDFLTKHWLITEIATGIYYWLQRLGPITNKLTRFLKKKSKSAVHCYDKLKNNALTYATHHDYDHIICGHTHHADFEYNQPYINLGCFTELECTYLIIDEDGDMEMIHV